MDISISNAFVKSLSFRPTYSCVVISNYSFNLVDYPLQSDPLTFYNSLKSNILIKVKTPYFIELLNNATFNTGLTIAFQFASAKVSEISTAKIIYPATSKIPSHKPSMKSNKQPNNDDNSGGSGGGGVINVGSKVSGLSSGAMIGIIIGIAVVVIAFILLLLYCFGCFDNCKRRNLTYEAQVAVSD